MQSRCPICSKKFSQDSLEHHVNICLDSQETKLSTSTVEAPYSSVSSSSKQIDNSDKPIQPSSQGQYFTDKDQKKRNSMDAFTALGLRMDSFGNKKKRSGNKKNQKERPTLTSILIAEKKLQAYASKKSNNDVLLTEDPSTIISNRYLQSEAESEIQIQRQLHISSSNNSNNPNDNENNECINDNDDNEDECSMLASKKKVSFSIPDTKDELKQASYKVHAKTEPTSESKILDDDQDLSKLRKDSALPLAERVRPKSLDDFHGQEHLLGKNGLLRNIIHADHIPSFILWGVPGVGKTSLARIIANTTSCRFVEVSGSDGNIKRLRDVFTSAENEKRLTGRKTILFLDEIHRFNKSVQDVLLPVLEKGVLTIIGATTENPSFSLNNALLSRMHTFVMQPLSRDAISRIIYKGLYHVNRTRKYIYGLHHIALKRDAADYIARLSAGDSRVALNILESIHAYLSHSQFARFKDYEKAEKDVHPDKTGVIIVTTDLLKPLLSTRNYHRMYDKHGESHYDTISAFHKSIRGSDPDAAVFYLTKMLSGGEDPLFIARRMIVIASEDIGLKDSSCLPFAIAVKEAIEFVGMPEGEIVLAHCTVKLARAPKSTKSYRALRTAQSLLNEKPELAAIPIPLHLRNAPTRLMKEMGYGKAYKYNPDFKYGRVQQSYLPDQLKDVRFLEKVHLGDREDPQISTEKYEKFKLEDEEYLNFKKFKKKLLKEEYLKMGSKSKMIDQTKVINLKQKKIFAKERLRSQIRNLMMTDPKLLDLFLDKEKIDSATTDINSKDFSNGNFSSKWPIEKEQQLRTESSKKSEQDILTSNSLERPQKQANRSPNTCKNEDTDSHLKSRPLIHEAYENEFSDTTKYSYDEFLSKEDQPDYFDGDEKDQYSDDPDCSHNFERSYDEFLDREAQPEYFDDGEIQAIPYDPEYPILYTNDKV